jgi:hypothetical protein
VAVVGFGIGEFYAGFARTRLRICVAKMAQLRYQSKCKDQTGLDQPPIVFIFFAE